MLRLNRCKEALQRLELGVPEDQTSHIRVLSKHLAKGSQQLGHVLPLGALSDGSLGCHYEISEALKIKGESLNANLSLTNHS